MTASSPWGPGLSKVNCQPGSGLTDFDIFWHGIPFKLLYRAMNKDFVLENTGSYDDWLIERLKDPREALSYLEAALEAYEEDSDTVALLLALRSVAYAQGRIGKLTAGTGISRDLLDAAPAGNLNPRLDNLPAILSSLGFRVRLERVESASANVSATIL